MSTDQDTADTTGDDITKEHREAIIKLGEEAGEFIQAMCKALNFGYVARCENRAWLNLAKMESECADMLAAIELCIQNGVFNRDRLNILASAKLEKMRGRLNCAKVVLTSLALRGFDVATGDRAVTRYRWVEHSPGHEVHPQGEWIRFEDI